MPHRTEMNGHVGCVGNQRAVATKDGAAVVATFLDVDADGGSTQDFSHRIGNSLQSSRDHFEQHRVLLDIQVAIDISDGLTGSIVRNATGDHRDNAFLDHACFPTRFDDECRVLANDHRRCVDSLTIAKGVPIDQAGLDPL